MNLWRFCVNLWKFFCEFLKFCGVLWSKKHLTCVVGLNGVWVGGVCQGGSTEMTELKVSQQNI